MSEPVGSGGLPPEMGWPQGCDARAELGELGEEDEDALAIPARPGWAALLPQAQKYSRGSGEGQGWDVTPMGQGEMVTTQPWGTPSSAVLGRGG